MSAMSRLATDLEDLYDAALPKDAPGAWIRAAIEQLLDEPEA